MSSLVKRFFNYNNPYRDVNKRLPFSMPQIGKCIIFTCLLFFGITYVPETIENPVIGSSLNSGTVLLDSDNAIDSPLIIKNISLSENKNLLQSENNPSITSDKKEEVKKEFNTKSEQDLWIQTEFRASDTSHQEWCVDVLLNGTYWKRQSKKCPSCRAQFSQDVFLARNNFFQTLKTVHNNNKSQRKFYVEAGANHYKKLSSTYFYDKCLGWDGLCIEPQKQYHDDITKHRSCTLVKKCLMKEKTEMMLGGMPPHRGGGMFVKPIPQNGVMPDGWERIECAPLQDIVADSSSSASDNVNNLEQKESSSSSIRTHIDLFVLDVEGAELVVLDSIRWDKLTFDTLLIENNKMSKEEKRKLDETMKKRGYPKSYQLKIDAVYQDTSVNNEDEKTSFTSPWLPKNNVVGLFVDSVQ